MDSHISLAGIKQSLIFSYLQANLRCLVYSANWAIELANSIDIECPPELPVVSLSELLQKEYCVYCMGQSLYSLRQFRRAAYVLKKCKSDEAFFLRNYCIYLAGEKDKEDDTIDALGPHEISSICNAELHGLKQRLAKRADKDMLDGYGYYLYGVVLKELCDNLNARKMLMKSISLIPILWCSWQELVKLCDDREMMQSLKVPDHWLRDFFYAEGSLELRLMQDALSYFNNLTLVGFSSSPYLTAKMAVVHFHLKNYPQAITVFDTLHNMDPYRIEDLNVYADTLFVMENLPKLSRLSMDVVKLDKYNPVSCSVLGNFYSLRGDHAKASLYFQRAVRLDKDNHSAWILLGHEFIELKNSSMAIEAYCKSLDVNKHDFRAYYGLGHTYEILRMPFFALHYYKQAYKLMPSDTSTLYALGSCYAELNQNIEAKKCLTRAIALKDQEGTALIKLAKLHAKLSEDEDAAKLYNRFIAHVESNEGNIQLPKEQGPAHLFLARYHFRAGSYKEAEAHAHKATEFLEAREEGKSLLQEILKKMAMTDTQGSQVEANLGSLSEIELSPIIASSHN